MVLLDTSVWIEYFRQIEPVASQVSDLLADQQVITVEPVFSELMFGARDVKERNVIRTYWQILPRVEFKEDSMFEASSYAFDSDLFSSNVNLIDVVIIRSAQRGGHKLWTLNERVTGSLDSSQLFQVPESRGQ